MGPDSSRLTDLLTSEAKTTAACRSPPSFTAPGKLQRIEAEWTVFRRSKMKLLRFSFYYISLWFRVWFGFYETFYPLGLKWRWRNWNYRNEAKAKMKLNGHN